MLVEFKQRFGKKHYVGFWTVNRWTPQSKRNIRQAKIKLKGAIFFVNDLP